MRERGCAGRVRRCKCRRLKRGRRGRCRLRLGEGVEQWRVMRKSKCRFLVATLLGMTVRLCVATGRQRVDGSECEEVEAKRRLAAALQKSKEFAWNDCFIFAYCKLCGKA